jgi:hypothetical protein
MWKGGSKVFVFSVFLEIIFKFETQEKKLMNEPDLPSSVDFS